MTTISMAGLIHLQQEQSHSMRVLKTPALQTVCATKQKIRSKKQKLRFDVQQLHQQVRSLQHVCPNTWRFVHFGSQTNRTVCRQQSGVSAGTRRGKQNKTGPVDLHRLLLVLCVNGIPNNSRGLPLLPTVSAKLNETQTP